MTGQPSACGTVREVGTLAHALPGGRVVAKPEHREQAEQFWNLPPGRVNPKPGYHTVKMWEQFCKSGEDGGDIDTIWVQVTNPGQTLPNLNKLFKPVSRFSRQLVRRQARASAGRAGVQECTARHPTLDLDEK